MQILNSSLSKKSGLHPRNKHHSPYDFEQLICNCPDLKQFVIINKFNNQTIDFSNPVAVKTLNQALLKHFYHVDVWNIPDNYLCPPIPGRVDYIHYLADILAESNNGLIPNGKKTTVLDIGVGANCIYPLLGHQEYKWNFIGADIDNKALKIASQIINVNSLEKSIELRLQNNNNHMYKGIIKPNEFIDITMCNPPFHSSENEAQKGTERKWKNLGYNKMKHTTLNFGGQHHELWCKGGESAFITKMILESISFSNQCLWFTTLVAKSEHLSHIYSELKKANAISVKTIIMSQGNKISRLVAWTFQNETQQHQWSSSRWQS